MYLAPRIFEFLGPVIGHVAEHGEGTTADHLLGSLPGILGILIGIFVFWKAESLAAMTFKALRPLSTLASTRYLIDEVYYLLIVAPLRNISSFLWRRVDDGLVAGSTNGLGYVTEATAEVARKLQTGQIVHYVFLMWFAVAVMLGMYLLP